jgi:hypothetical protein
VCAPKFKSIEVVGCSCLCKGWSRRKHPNLKFISIHRLFIWSYCFNVLNSTYVDTIVLQIENIKKEQGYRSDKMSLSGIKSFWEITTYSIILKWRQWSLCIGIIRYIHTLLYFEHLSLFIWPCLKEDENFKRKANMQDMFFFFFWQVQRYGYKFKYLTRNCIKSMTIVLDFIVKKNKSLSHHLEISTNLVLIVSSVIYIQHFNISVFWLKWFIPYR